jgi:hypothetical protein
VGFYEYEYAGGKAKIDYASISKNHVHLPCVHSLSPLILFLPLITQRPKRIVYHVVRVSALHRRTLSQDFDFYGLFGSIRLDQSIKIPHSLGALQNKSMRIIVPAYMRCGACVPASQLAPKKIPNLRHRRYFISENITLIPVFDWSHPPG